MDQLAESSLALDETVGDVHLLAESGKPDDKFNGFDIIGNSDNLGLSVLNELSDMVESEFEVMGFNFGNIFL